MDSINLDLMPVSEYLDSHYVRHVLRSDHVFAYNPNGFGVMLTSVLDAVKFVDRWYNN